VPYEEGDDVVRLTRKLQQAGLPKAVRRELVKSRLKSLKMARHDSTDYATQVRNLELTARLSWHPTPRPPVDLARVRSELDRAHHGMHKSKRRIEEWVSIRALGGEARSTILCLAGPPGTGKTTIARAIAEALGRPFCRVAVGGMHDECELRGHRMSFHAAAPGRIIEEVARSGAMDPVLLLDEIDKLGTDTGRSPAAALMEILDPEQHVAFQDNFLALPYDLSRVMFVCTANEIERVRGPLRDRLEVIEIEGYSVQEKLPIARTHILPALARELGLLAVPDVDDAVLRALIEGYTRESGVRALRRVLASLLRDRVHALASAGVLAGDPQPPPAPLTLDDLHRVLGAPRASVRVVPERLPIGACLGLSVGADGGAPMRLEVGRQPASRPGGELILTGQLGEVMRESVRTVLAHLRLCAAQYQVNPAEVVGDWFVHAPEAAVPKDGPSAGVALLVAMVSALRGVAVPADTAITGEMSLHGDILPVGGVRAKCLAAERAGLARVFLPRGCEPDVPAGLRCAVVAVDRAEQVVAALWPTAPGDPS
jgi:ATP-dependent Lon protease